MAALLMAATLSAAEPGSVAVDVQVANSVRQALAALDAAGFAERDKAARQLEALVANPHLASFLAAEFTRTLAAVTTSSEVATRVESLLARLPSFAAADIDQVHSAAEIGPLLDQLDRDSSRERSSARRRLRLALEDRELVGPIITQIKRRLAQDHISRQTWRELDPLLEQARAIWITSDPDSVKLPGVSDAEMEHSIDLFIASEESDDSGGSIHHLNAKRELIDLVVRDDTRPRLLTRLEAKLAAGADSLRPIGEFALPAMAAEAWNHDEHDWDHRQHELWQQLLVGVPQFPDIAIKATHFDRIDDKTAHCVSGNNLSPGDYPVGLAIPHPGAGRELMFHLVNLPTPRRRLAYEYYLKQDESRRLAQISQRTLDDFLARKHPLNELEVLLLCQLDPACVSRFVAPYFQAVGDRKLLTKNDEAINRLTIHGAICHMLARVGTHEAIAALEQTARSGRLGRPNEENPYAIAWIAALAAARRDPWPGVDEWLMGLVDDASPLVFSEPAAELGATAAALVLERREMQLGNFGLEQASEQVFEPLHFVGYRFSSPSGRQELRRWWNKQSSAAKSVP